MILTLGRSVFLIFFVCLFSISESASYYESSRRTLYVAEEPNINTGHFYVINRYEDASAGKLRNKRDAIPTTPVAQKNISTWTTHLNDSHQQLMVHWLGEGSEVIVCLARDTAPRGKDIVAAPSSLYISYNYGKTFMNKTELFKLGDAPNSGYAQLDKFFNHPKYPEICVFVDSTNKRLFYTTDNGINIHRTDLDFHPSEVAYDEEHPNRFVISDKVSTDKKLYLTQDGGKSFSLIQSYVKSFYWSSGAGFPKAFYIERYKPDENSTVFTMEDPADAPRVLFQDARDFQIKGDYMFATKKSKESNTLDLYISHQRGPFIKAEFQTELDLRKFHIADSNGLRIFISVMHTDIIANLYVSEISRNFTEYHFVLSMERVLCYFPDGNWKDSLLEDVTEDPFTDLYRVEGLKGIYIASKVESKANAFNIGPEHLVSLITFDHGATWSHIKPPAEDENGKPLNCHIENSCSLHLCQKFSQLYPVTRSASIMSSKAAPGVIMATGVMGKSLKGIPGVYISRDAGFTWKRILKDYYFFNYGDHGGVLLAVKYFKSRGETNKILYSTNEGIEWNAYQFNADDLRIYGLMTEPGENTTTFTMFGSANNFHQWIIITIDLFNAFARNCTQEDYKFWAPSPPNSSVTCVMGTRDLFQRRSAHTNCYNGKNYVRPIKKEVCQCSRRDFECDFGFMLMGHECVRNKSIRYDPYSMPPDCLPGHYYKRTKGYRKIDGNVCTISSYLPYVRDNIPCPLEEPTEFILVALRDKIARIDLADNSTVYPVQDQKNIVAIEFDMKNNCIYWADIELDKISRQCFNNGTTQEVVVDTDLSSIEGMALDYISNVLFFVDGMRKKIEAVRTDLSNQGRMRVTILDSKVLSKPRGIAVHPRAGYLFWTDWDRNNASVSRSNLDGTDVKKLFGKPIVQWPNGITIDQMSDRIYWVDAMEDYIACADLDGRYFRRILWNDDKVSHPFAVAVLKDKMYWDDWKAKSIFIGDKDTGINVITINDSFTGLMDLKVFAHFVQHGSNACSYKNTSCDTICLGGPGSGFRCLCPDGFKKVNGKCLCQNGLEPLANMTCPKKTGATTCEPDQFACKNGMCINSNWRCDGNNDCGDLSDEIGCPVCVPPMISCDNDTRCYLPHWKCDADADCLDLSDEKDCGSRNCTETQFSCDVGKCIDKKWVCDGDNDCIDGSDERNCTNPTLEPFRPFNLDCQVEGFKCENSSGNICISRNWVCDGDPDCPQGEDETQETCSKSVCGSKMFRCLNGKCLHQSWVCDGQNDCEDASDEQNCTNTSQGKLLPATNITPPAPRFPSDSSCMDWMFKCNNNKCIPYWWRCDGINDCGDSSDESACGIIVPEVEVKPEHNVSRVTCEKTKFSCSPGVCIPLSWVCDTAEDCDDGSDEKDCGPRSVKPGCSADQWRCHRGQCVSAKARCDGKVQCDDGSDEANCPPEGSSIPRTYPICGAGFFMCDDGIACISMNKVCDGRQDCYDETDEANCTMPDRRQNPPISIGVDQTLINSTSFLVSCWMPQQKDVIYKYLPSIAKVNDGVWKNMTWTIDGVYRFTDLEPFTNYNVTFYIYDDKNAQTIASMRYVNTTTKEGVPSPPLRLAIRQKTGSRVEVEFDPPKDPRGTIKYYMLYYSPPLPPIETYTNNTKLTVSGYFKANHNYSFWVTATNNEHTSPYSQVWNITFDSVGDVDDIANVSLTRLTTTDIRLEWHKIRGIEGYIVKINPPYNYAPWEPMKTKETSMELSGLPPGVQVNIHIMAYKGSITGEPFTLSIPIEGVKDEVLNLTTTLLSDKRTSVQLKWSAPIGERYANKDLQYDVYYMNKGSELRPENLNNATHLVTKNTQVTIENLKACESYMFTAALHRGPLAVPREIITRENPKAAVKNLHFALDEVTSRLRIMWNANCDIIREAVSYRLVITDLSQNKVSRYELAPSKNVTLTHIIENIPSGGKFNVCVYSDVEDAAVTCKEINGLSIPAPSHVVAWKSPDGHLIVNWLHLDQRSNNKYKFEILTSENEIPSDLLQPTEDIKSNTADSSPFLNIDMNSRYVAVRAVTQDGYYGELSEVKTLYMESIAASETSSASTWWGVGLGAACVAMVVFVATRLVLRRRRLSQSFMAFTVNAPRYRSPGHPENDDDDVPAIQGFSDDEPLVIA